MRDVKLSRDFIYFFFSPTFLFFRTQKKFSCNIISHTHTTSGKPSYWDERYTKDPEAFDWYQRSLVSKRFWELI